MMHNFLIEKDYWTNYWALNILEELYYEIKKDQSGDFCTIEILELLMDIMNSQPELSK